MKTTKYGLVRKTPKGNWKPIWNEDDNGESMEGGLNSDRERVQRTCQRLTEMFTEHAYAVIEVTV